MLWNGDYQKCVTIPHLRMITGNANTSDMGYPLSRSKTKIGGTIKSLTSTGEVGYIQSGYIVSATIILLYDDY